MNPFPQVEINNYQAGSYRPGLCYWNNAVGQRNVTCAGYLRAIIPFMGSKLWICAADDSILEINNRLELNCLEGRAHEANFEVEK